MSVLLPVIPRGTVVTPHLVRTGGDLTSVLGGPTQRITRLGTRYAVDVELPPLDAACASEWLSCALQAEALGETLTLPMPQMIPAARTMVGVTGSGAAGSNVITIATPPVPPVGAWLSFLAGGRSYLHFVTTASGTQITVGPLLRASIPTATPLQLESPLLEGFADDTSWSLEFFRFVGNKFTITENA